MKNPPVSQEKKRFKPCKNRARWCFYDDKYVPGYSLVCTTCLLAFYRDGVSHVRRIDKPRLLDGRCGIEHSANYDEVVESLGERHLNEDLRCEPQLLVSNFGLFRSFLEHVGNGGAVKDLKYDVQVPWGMDQVEAEQARSKARWLVGVFCNRLDKAGYTGEIEGVRLQEDIYILCLRNEGSLQHARIDRNIIDRNIIDDMTDSARPHAETEAKFNTILETKIKEILKEGRERNGEGEI